AAFSCNLATSTNEISQLLEQFWKTEELAIQAQLSLEENMCESHFKDTTKRDKVGRFIVSIPFQTTAGSLGESREMAERRLKSLERRLQADKKMRDEYVAFLRKYRDLGHMTKIIDNGLTSQAYYLPHHGVWKENSLTTKLRVVFDASAPTSTGVSINDLQMIGPTIQRDLMSILL
ncbi:PREDICTED: uncharacterized protein LOC105460827, partial [Wasmannia auropunctata]|uniref:uncharacterized protein LOC105460827 n=1 Tax=Wasmannia auropunctata TaxID=64793 RepID=UPI0005EF3C4E